MQTSGIMFTMPIVHLLKGSGIWYILAVWQLYKAALGNCFEIDDWGPIEFSIMAKHFDRQGKPPYAYHAVSFLMLCKYIRDQLCSLFSIYLPCAVCKILIPAFVVCFQQYMSHLLSHGQLDGSG
jgi:hypothetical protein